MKRIPWQISLTALFVAVSAALYALHYFIFRDLHHIILYLIGDIAFLPIDAIIVTFVLHAILTKKERENRMRKLNMVIGTFFSEVGAEILAKMAALDDLEGKSIQKLSALKSWNDLDFKTFSRSFRGYQPTLAITPAALESLRSLLSAKKDFLLALIANPNLLEHEAFTDLLWAIFHLMEELSARKKVSELPEKDLDHLSGDIKRVDGLLISTWIEYQAHLRKDYPYLHSLAVRMNPFDPDRRAEIS